MQRGRILIYVFWVVGAIYFLGSLAASIYFLVSPATSNKPFANVGALHSASPHVVVATLVIPPVIPPIISPDGSIYEPAFLADSPVRFLPRDETVGGTPRSVVVRGQTGFSRGE
jgi:hypothetical protein